MKPAMIYFADPMCSWCWGFAPVVERVLESYADRFEPSLVLGGLAPGTAEPLDQYRKDAIREHWRHVNELSGQAFDHAFFDREGFVYDTGPACRAVVTVRLMAPGAEFPYLRALHHAFYASNRDITDRATLAGIAVESGCNADVFERTYDDPKTGLATGNDFSITQAAGIGGFPALVVGQESAGLSAITVGYQDYPSISAALDAWLEQHP